MNVGSGRIIGKIRSLAQLPYAGWIVVDFPPQSRTIFIHDPYDLESPPSHVFLPLPYLRFFIGFNQGLAGYFWDRSLCLLGNTKAFSGDLDRIDEGFSMPLPNFNAMGFLTCSGTMPFVRNKESPEDLVISVLNDFWSSSFYSILDSSSFYYFHENSPVNLVNIWQIRSEAPAIYSKLPVFSDRLIQNSTSLEWIS